MRTELKFHDNFQSEIQLKNIENKIGKKDFTIRTDYPEVMGGDEEYPTPLGCVSDSADGLPGNEYS